MAGCPDEAAAVWESLRQESKKMQFAGNLYDMCSSRSQSAAGTGAQNPDETNQESLKGKASHLSQGQSIFLATYLCLLFLYLWIWAKTFCFKRHAVECNELPMDWRVSLTLTFLKGNTL